MKKALCATALLFAACASVPSAPPIVASPEGADAVTLRQSLEEAYAHVLTRESTASTAPAADVEAAASIAIPQHRTIQSAVQLFTKDLHDDIQTSLVHSTKYMKLIDSALDEHKLPRALAYLPVIESAYESGLTSRAGAHGMWQFMPDTAREYGLRVDEWIDERADPEKSTRAAAAYLEDLYREFGDWPLALAAYNCGPNRVKRVLASTGATTFWQLLEMSALPKETRGYVPTFYATLLIVSDPSAYGFTLETSAPNEQLAAAQIRVDGPLALQYVAEAVGIDEEQLREMNPTLRRAMVPPGGATLRVPARALADLDQVRKKLRAASGRAIAAGGM